MYFKLQCLRTEWGALGHCFYANKYFKLSFSQHFPHRNFPKWLEGGVVWEQDRQTCSCKMATVSFKKNQCICLRDTRERKTAAAAVESSGEYHCPHCKWTRLLLNWIHEPHEGSQQTRWGNHWKLWTSSSAESLSYDPPSKNQAKLALKRAGPWPGIWQEFQKMWF